MHIESRQNETVKRIRSLHSKKGRQALFAHLAEGEKLVEEAANSGMRLESVFYEEGFPLPPGVLSRAEQVYSVTRPVMEALCDTKTPQHVCAAVHTPPFTPPDSYPRGMLVALDTLQDPGNIGTIIRTADAMGAVGILFGEGTADPYAPKCIRAAMGSTYHVNLFEVNLKEALQTLHHDGYCCICGDLQGEERLPPLRDRCVIVIGNEGNGVHEDIAALCSRVRLPMYGRAQSLNASMAAGLLMYEAAKEMHTLTQE